MNCLVSFEKWEFSPWNKEERKKLSEFLESKGVPFILEFKVTEKDGKKDEVCENDEFWKKDHVFDICELSANGIPFKVRKQESKLKNDVLVRMATLLEKIAKIEATKIQDKNITVNINSESHWLHAVNEVTVEEDFCTDSLRDRLNEGWRIVAVCNNSKNRRPDYVLGRFKIVNAHQQTSSNLSDIF